MIWRYKNIQFSTLLLNLFIPSVYGDFFGTDSPPSIRQDVVFINGTDINSIDSMMPTMNYNDNIIPTDDTPDPPSDGVAGILYDRGLSCNPTNSTSGFQFPPYNLRPGVPKIALILRGECYFSTKLQLASGDPGIVAAVVYDNISFANDTTEIDGISIEGSLITFPVFYVDWSLGISMQAMINNLASGNTTTQNTNTTLKGVRITLYPGSSQSYPAIWEFTLILVVILLAISFIASLCMHCHLYRNRRRQTILHRDSTINMLPIQAKPVIRRDVLETFPVTIFRGQQPAILISDITNDEDVSSRPITPAVIIDQQPATPVRTASIRSVRSHRAVENAQALTNRDRRISVDSTSRNIAPDLQETVCAICLSEFELGDMVRTLPCHHEYHVKCIDPWLLSQSSECPLCKHDCSTLPR